MVNFRSRFLFSLGLSLLTFLGGRTTGRGPLAERIQVVEGLDGAGRERVPGMARISVDVGWRRVQEAVEATLGGRMMGESTFLGVAVVCNLYGIGIAVYHHMAILVIGIGFYVI